MRFRAASTLAVILFLTVSAAAASEKTLFTFLDNTTGVYPYGGVTVVSQGNVYGTTTLGGSGNGIVFELKHSNGVWNEDVIYQFAGGNDGSGPTTALVFGPNGHLYGTTYSGGKYGAGTVFDLKRSNGIWHERIIHTFDGTHGLAPFGDLIFDSRGSLYGTTQLGGIKSQSCTDEYCGVVFELSPSTDGNWKYTILHRFTGGRDGGSPQAGLVFDAAGNLYGSAYAGGASGGGVIFELSPQSDGTWKETTLHSFTGRGKDGAYPSFRPILDDAGNIYGTTQVGGVGGSGIVFKLSPSKSKWPETVLYSFTGGSDGGVPIAGVTLGPNGVLYGTVNQDVNGFGGVFELKSSSHGWVETVLYGFMGGADGANPIAGIWLDSAGNLFGATYGDGESQTFGSVFEVVP